MKYLLLLAVLGVIWWLLTKRAQTPSEPSARVRNLPPEKMFTCAYCGVHFPESDVISDGDDVYCCVEHRQARRSKE